ncbi:hypothetical protein HL669_21880 (plasmid) [Vibrio parahaemolyticus]|uniref:hypothetical protein n=1 Tax=Vibrio parahaemolyticus TaxID=670 RepID=UPI001484F9DF|nr:hypothetical protein [Vibrio parahaemolyticus]NNU14264.1 hypothetical protein [Vibrio parahaemolyticus]
MSIINNVKILSQILLPELGERQSMSLLLFYFYGRKTTASYLGISNLSVRDNIYRARKRLRAQHKIEDVEYLVISRMLENIML